MNREDIIRMAEESGLHIFGLGLDRKKFYFFVEQFFDMAQAAEREACAKVCDELADASNLVYAGTAAMKCAKAIRARGQA